MSMKFWNLSNLFLVECLIRALKLAVHAARCEHEFDQGHRKSHVQTCPLTLCRDLT